MIASFAKVCTTPYGYTTASRRSRSLVLDKRETRLTLHCAFPIRFLQECTYSYFNENSRCPSCGKSLGVNDFMELVVAEPSSATEEALKYSFQSVFTKFTSNATSISQQELCSRFLKNFDNERRVARFLLKQFVTDCFGARNRAAGVLRVSHTAPRWAGAGRSARRCCLLADGDY